MSPEPTADRESLQVVTNSDVDFANFVMHVSFGADWRKLFDFVGFFARKGRGFFEADAKDSPFLTLPHFPDPGDLPLGSAVNSRGLPLNVRGPPAPAVRSLPPPPATHARRHVSAHTHTRVHTHTHRNVRTHVSAHTHTHEMLAPKCTRTMWCGRTILSGALCTSQALTSPLMDRCLSILFLFV